MRTLYKRCQNIQNTIIVEENDQILIKSEFNKNKIIINAKLINFGE